MVSQNPVRHINQSRLLRALVEDGPMSRAEIARKLEMMRSTAGNLVSALIAEGAIRETGATPAEQPETREAGRPGRKVEVNPAHALFLGASLGVGEMSVVLIDLAGTGLASRSRAYSLSAANPEHIAALLSDLVRDALGGNSKDNIQGLCLAVPAQVDFGGAIKTAPMLGWENVHLTDALAAKFHGIPEVRLENDANAFAQQERQRLSSDPVSDALFLWLDAGVGGAILSGGTLMRGSGGFAGEFGHIYVGENPYNTRSPLPCSLESFVGRSSILSIHRELGGEADDIDALYSLVGAGGPVALETMNIWSTALARGLASLISAFNPERIIVGGPVAKLLHFTQDSVRTITRSYLMPSTDLPPIQLSPIGNDATAIGGAMILREKYLDPDRNVVRHWL